MKKSLIAGIAILTALFALIIGSVQAQDAALSYYLAPDANGVQQVYQLILDGQSAGRQVTHADSDVITFNAAYDGLAVAYISAGQLWLQPIHTDEPEALVSVSAKQFLGAPVFSQDGQYIAYADNGVWLFDLGARVTKQILANVELDANASNAPEVRGFQPERFVLDSESKAAQLVVKISVWEWDSAGLYDLASGTLQELAGQIHTRLLPLSDGRVLVYGNSGLGGDMALHIADTSSDINSYHEIVNFSDLTDEILFAEQAMEIAAGVVRVFGSTLAGQPEAIKAFSFDVDVTSGTPSEVKFLTLSEVGTGNVIAGQLSPDGGLVPVHVDASWTEAGSIYGKLKVFNVNTGEDMLTFPDTTGALRWQQ